MNLREYVIKTDIGIHTVSFYAKNLKYQEVQRAIDRQMEKRNLQIRKQDPYNIDRSLKDTYFIKTIYLTENMPEFSMDHTRSTAMLLTAL